MTAGTTAITTGQVNFCDATAIDCTDIHLLGTAQLTSAGTASLKLRPAIGKHIYKAVFPGTANDAASLSNGSALSVTGIFPTATAITETGSPGDYTLVAAVGIPSQVAAGPTGEVSFVDTSNNNSVVGTAALGSTVNTPILINVSNPPTYTRPSLNVAGDFNGDGILDLAIGNTFAPYFVTVLLGDGTGNFTPAPNSPFAAAGDPVLTQDFNGDGIADLLLSGRGSTSLTVMLGNGDGTFTAAPGSLTTLYGTYPVIAADFNGDGIPDIAAAGGFYLNIFLGKGDGSFTALPTSPTVTDADITNSMAVGDLNGDGVTDLVTITWAGDHLEIYLGKGDGTFSPAPGSPMSSNGPTVVAIGDFNQDGKLDLALPYYGANTAAGILLGNGDGTFQTAATTPITVDLPPFLATLGDFNGDGIVDLFFGAQVNGTTINILLGKGDGTFSLMPTGTAGLPCCSDTVLGDFNGDGITDSASSSFYYDSAYILLTEPMQADATLTGAAVSPTGPLNHLVTANYPADSHYGASTAVPTDVLAQAATPVFTPSAGTYTSTQMVSISDSTPGVTIRYTTDGSTPIFSSAAYTVPLTISSSQTVRAIATDTIYITSSVASSAYVITPPAPTPTFTPTPGTYTVAQSVVLSDSLAGATIYFTTDGSTPTTSSSVYKGPIVIPSSETIKAIATATGDSASPVGMAVYVIQIPQAPTPTFTPAPGTYPSAQSVSIADSLAGTTIYFTTDGSTPTTSSSVYKGPIVISSSETIKAVATATGDVASPVGTAVYAIQIPPPALGSFSPAFTNAGGGPFPLTVNGSGFVSGSTVYWGTTAVTTQYVSGLQLVAQIPATAISAQGTFAISVKNPASGGGNSNALQFEVDSTGAGPAPTFTPATAAVNAGSSPTYSVTLPASASAVGATCLNLPSGATCAFSAATDVVTITTSSTTPSGTYPITVVFTETLPAVASGLLAFPLLLLPLTAGGRNLIKTRLAWLACLGVLFVVGCGGGGSVATTTQPTQQVTNSGLVTLTVK